MMDASIPTTGPELRQLREAAGVSMFDITVKLGLPESTLSLIERDRKEMPEDLPHRYRKALVEITRDRASLVKSACSVRKSDKRTGVAA